MAKAVSEATLSWLYSVLHDYANIQRTYADAAQTLSRFPTLQPRTEVHTFENGIQTLLVTLSGTLPTTFRNTTYQFPVKVWIPRNYPQESPFLYVLAGKEMQIRPGQHVAVDGKLYHPYLRDWVGMWDRASIVELLDLIQQAFGKEPPVTSRQSSSIRPIVARALPSANSTAGGPPPPPPRPPKPGSSLEHNPRTNGPPLPPLPGSRPQASRYDTAPPLPSMQRYQQPLEQAPQYHHNIQVRGPNSSNSRNNDLRNPQIYVQQQVSTPLRQTTPQQWQQIQQPVQRKAAQDLLSDPFDITLPTTASSVPAPPIPPNPERIHLLQALSATLVQQAQQNVDQNTSALAPLQIQHGALKAAQSRLESELAQLQALDQALATNESILHRSIQDCDRTIEQAKTKQQPPIDDVLVATTLVAQQLWTVSAEEAACQESMHAIQVGLDKGRISAGQFTRQIRGLGRERFLKLAMARKCALGLGLEVSK